MGKNGVKSYLFEAGVMVDNLDSLLDDFEQIDLTQVDFERLVLELREVKQVQHEDSHQLRRLQSRL